MLVGALNNYGRKMELEVGVSRYKLFYTEWIDKKILLYSAGNSTPYPVLNHVGKEY